MKIKKGDNVIVRTGKDKGKTGSVAKVFPALDQIIVDGLNKVKKHVKKTGSQEGGVIEISKPMHVSNVMIVDPKTKKPSRIGKKRVGEKYVRIARKSGQEI
jgi:large subunit ribosomal protein L24